MAQKRKGNLNFTPVYDFLLNTKGRPKLSPLEREFVCRIHTWTHQSKRYNYESFKAWANRLGVSDKTLNNSAHRLRALGLIDWYSFPDGVGVKHLRYATAEMLKKWEAAADIKNPTPADIEKARQFTPIEILVERVCKQPERVGFDIWQACCLYCGFAMNQGEHQPAEILPAAEAVQLPWETQEFTKAWGEWVQYRKAAGKGFVSKAQEQRAAIELHKDTNGDAAAAIGAIHSAIAGGFFALRPDISQKHEIANVKPLNCYDYVMRKVNESKQLPANEAELIELMRQFGAINPDAPAWVTKLSYGKGWAPPNDWDLKHPSDMPKWWKPIFENYEKLRVKTTTGESFTGGEEKQRRWEQAKMEAEKQKVDERLARKKWDEKMRAEVEFRAKKMGWAEDIAKDYNNPGSYAMMQIWGDITDYLPESLSDFNFSEDSLTNPKPFEVRKSREIREKLRRYGWEEKNAGSELNWQARMKFVDAELIPQAEPVK